MQISGFWQDLFVIASAAKVDTDIQDCGGKSAFRRHSHQHHKISVPSPHETGNGHDGWQLSDSRLHVSPPSPPAFFCPAGGLTFTVPREAEGDGASQEGTGQGVRWQEVMMFALTPFHTTHLWTEEARTTSATGLCRWPHLGELMHTQDETSPTFAQLRRKGRGNFNTKKVQLVCSLCAMMHVGKWRGLCFSLTPSLPCKVRGNLIFSLYISLDSELFTCMCLEPGTLTVA